VTVADLIEFLQECPQDSPVWIVDPNTDWDAEEVVEVIAPVESISNTPDGVFIG
jgi:hypothetical protein